MNQNQKQIKDFFFKDSATSVIKCKKPEYEQLTAKAVRIAKRLKDECEENIFVEEKETQVRIINFDTGKMIAICLY